MKKILIKIYEFLKKLWNNPIIKFIIKWGSIILTGVIAFLFIFSKVGNLFSKIGKKSYEDKVKDLDKEKEKDEKIINNSNANDYDEHGIRIRKNRKNR